MLKMQQGNCDISIKNQRTCRTEVLRETVFTDSLPPFYAGAEIFAGSYDNTDIHDKLCTLLGMENLAG